MNALCVSGAVNTQGFVGRFSLFAVHQLFFFFFLTGP